MHVQRIVIVGGGTAGWLSACYLQRALGENITIELVESTEVDPIGVGEATIPTMKRTMRFLGFTEEQWMPQIGATFKTAIKFCNWMRPRDVDADEHYWHPFISRPEPHVMQHDAPYFTVIGEGFSLVHAALRRRLDGGAAIAEQMTMGPSLGRARKAPWRTNERDGVDEPESVYAYHIDAGLYAGFLRRTAKERGVRQTVGHVVDVKQNPDGNIASVTLRDGQTIAGDLFIDCTGFRRLLIGKTLREPFQSDNNHLLCDRAVAIPSSNNPEVDGIKPYTTATGLSAGWSWQTPLFHRNGSGYVYSSEFMDADGAEDELRTFLGPACAGQEANHLRMQVGSLRNWWSGNCVAIGLSGSFIEPLESTAIFFIEYGLAALVHHFPDKEMNGKLRQHYNDQLRDMYSELRDFVVMHYVLSERDDTPFWRAARHETTLPETLREKIELFQHRLPLMDAAKLTIFRSFNYACILDGLNALPGEGYAPLEIDNYEKAFAALDKLQADLQERSAEMASHYKYLKSIGCHSPTTTK